MTTGAILSFGLAHFASSEFELLAEELLMSDSIIKASSMFLITLSSQINKFPLKTAVDACITF